ncbi:MAG: hypothetical protein ABIK09_15115 [Pseudomonadota bacterium]
MNSGLALPLPDWTMVVRNQEQIAHRDSQSFVEAILKNLENNSLLRAHRREECLQPFLDEWSDGAFDAEDWNGEGAVPVDDRAVWLAWRIINSLPRSFPIPYIDVYPDGSVGLQWVGHVPHHSIVVKVKGDHTLVFAAILGKHTSRRGTEVWTGELPADILEHVRDVLGIG